MERTVVAKQQPRGLNSVIVKVAQLCNLNCSYCYMYNHEDQSWRTRPKEMQDDVFDAMLHRILRYCDRHDRRFNIIFHGGEPTLIGPERFARHCGKARTVLGDRLHALSIQTNATLIDDEWIRVFKEYRVGAGVSIDGLPETHDRNRVDHAGRGSHSATLRGLRLIQESGLPNPGVICFIDPGADGAATYRYLRSLGVKWIHLILPQVSHDNKERLYGAFGPTPVSDFLIPAFDAWFDEDDPQVKVLVFWGLLRALMGGEGWKDDFGNPLHSYLVIDSDGSIDALDSLKVCDEGLNRGNLNVLEHDFDDVPKGSPLLHMAVNEGVPLCKQCRECPERDTCGGGYLPARYSKANGFDNPTVWCEDNYLLLQHLRKASGISRADFSYLKKIRAAKKKSRPRLVVVA